MALISRSQENLDALTRQLADEGIHFRGYVANARDSRSLRSALDAAATELGTIEALRFSPKPATEFMKPELNTTAEDLIGPIEQSVHGLATAVQQVLPGMRELGRGSIMLVNGGGSAVIPRGSVAGTSVAFAAEGVYGQMLHDALADERIYVGQLIIPRGIGGGDADHEPDALAERIWHLHQEQGRFRYFVGE